MPNIGSAQRGPNLHVTNKKIDDDREMGMKQTEDGSHVSLACYSNAVQFLRCGVLGKIQ
ncbi:unnamed protein product [Sphenostylis stenocarpa]|uniref:Uncharacterized protein n=1 Tax=Sphenostylis stenocarpa TaxID=92480 RepID=A0AA86TPC6_9FABA|nr:unnamed protein product [Sphenostylis stenocarpa]